MNRITSSDAIDRPLMLLLLAVVVMGSVLEAAVFTLDVNPLAAERLGTVEGGVR